MSIIESKIDPRSESFAANAKAMRALVDTLHQNSDRVAEGGGPDRAARHKKRGKLLARERIARLLDQGIRSGLRDLDYIEASSRFGLLQVVQQAGLQSAASAQSLSLLDFLG